jgi:hypothetical protein
MQLCPNDIVQIKLQASRVLRARRAAFVFMLMRFYLFALLFRDGAHHPVAGGQRLGRWLQRPLVAQHWKQKNLILIPFDLK